MSFGNEIVLVTNSAGVLEYDSAYRFRFQDILGEVDLSQIKLDEAEMYYFNNRPDYDIKANRKK